MKWMWGFAVWSAFGVAALIGAVRAQEPVPEFNPRVVVNRTFKPIVDAPVLAADQVTDEVRDHELVLGVVVEGEARAYPINMLTGPSREIINDTLGGHAIAATW